MHQPVRWSARWAGSCGRSGSKESSEAASCHGRNGVHARRPRLRAQPQRVPTVCFVSLATPQSDQPSLDAFRAGLLEHGYVEGSTYRLVWIASEGNVARAEAQVREHMARQVDVFLAPGPASARLILRATQSVPIVVTGLHPRGGQTDLFATLAKPGGRVTGVSSFGEELAAKRVELLKEVVPKLAHVGVLHNTADPVFRRWGEETEAAIRAQGLAATRLGLTSLGRRVAAHPAGWSRAGRSSCRRGA